MTSLINPIWHLWVEGGNLGKIPVDANKPDGEKLDPSKIEEFFANKLKEYCQIVLKSTKCPVFKNKGCGLNSFCGESKNGIVTTCEDDNSKVGYKCVEPVRGPVEEWCKSDTEYGYKVILGKCFQFQYYKQTFQSAKQNCRSKIKEGIYGKLAEPRTLEMAEKLVEASRDAYESPRGYGEDLVFIGVEKIDNNGNMKYTSTGLKTPISPWKKDYQSVKNGMGKPYICYLPIGSFWFKDCDSSYKGWSVCEF